MDDFLKYLTESNIGNVEKKYSNEHMGKQEYAVVFHMTEDGHWTETIQKATKNQFILIGEVENTDTKAGRRGLLFSTTSEPYYKLKISSWELVNS